MGQVNFEDVFNSLKQGVTGLAQTTVTGYVAQAETDGQGLLDQMKANLQTWTTQLLNHEITQAEFSENLEDQKAVLQMAALTQAGIAEATLDNFKSGIISLVETTVFGLL